MVPASVSSHLVVLQICVVLFGVRILSASAQLMCSFMLVKKQIVCVAGLCLYVFSQCRALNTCVCVARYVCPLLLHTLFI